MIEKENSLIRYIVFSDLDGTLLDYHSYSFSPAGQALDFLRSNQIPLILVSSKTHPEMIRYQELLGFQNLPFVVENGSAIYSPVDYFLGEDRGEIRSGLNCEVLGKTFSEIKQTLTSISVLRDYEIRGFHNADRGEVKEKTGLAYDELQMALDREFSIPLFFDERAAEILREEMDQYGLQILYGGRFMHLLGRVNKGEALKLIMARYRQKFSYSDLKSIALGDSLNDFAMLEAADISVLVKKYDGTYEDREPIQKVIYSPGIGPEGWNNTLLTLLENGGNHE